MAETALERAIQCLPRCAPLSVYDIHHAGEDRSIPLIKALSKLRNHHIQKLQLAGRYYAERQLDAHFSQLGSLTSPASLSLSYVVVETIPYFPSLREARLKEAPYPIRQLYRFFSTSITLETIEVIKSVDNQSLEEDPFRSDVRLDLPSLRHLLIPESLAGTAELIMMFPYPRATLQVLVDDFPDYPTDWLFSEDLEQGILI
jgi:hypothetical protein